MGNATRKRRPAEPSGRKSSSPMRMASHVVLKMRQTSANNAYERLGDMADSLHERPTPDGVGLRASAAASLRRRDLLRADGHLGGLGDTELEHGAGRNLDGLAGLRIAAHALLALHDDELADAREREALLRLAVGELRDLFEDRGT